MKLIFDVGLDSDIDLPELPDVSNADTVIRIKRATKNSDWIKELDWQYHWRTDNVICISMAKVDDGYVLKFPELADFSITSSNQSIEYYADTKIPPESIRHLLLDQVIPRVLGQQGRLVLHASATVLQGDSKAIAFIGSSGWGKSTLATSFLEGGAKLLTDDCLLIEIRDDKVFCTPNYFGLRLFDDSVDAIFGEKQQSIQVAHYSEKKRLLTDQHEGSKLSSQVELGGIFLLGDPLQNIGSMQINIKPVSGAEDFMKLIAQIFIIDVSEPNLYGKLFKYIGKILSHGVPIYGLEYPREYLMLSSVQKSVKDIVNNT